MNDYETIEVQQGDDSCDFNPVFAEAMKRTPSKLLMYIFIIYMFLSSDVFIGRILSKMNGAVGPNDTATSYGTVITGVLLVIFTSVAYGLIQSKII